AGSDGNLPGRSGGRNLLFRNRAGWNLPLPSRLLGDAGCAAEYRGGGTHPAAASAAYGDAAAHPDERGRAELLQIAVPRIARGSARASSGPAVDPRRSGPHSRGLPDDGPALHQPRDAALPSHAGEPAPVPDVGRAAVPGAVWRPDRPRRGSEAG